MSWEPKPKNITVHHHRNRIGGRGFTAITFTEDDPDEPTYNGRLTAIIPDEDKYKLHDVECFVIHTSDTDLCYRGDVYHGAMVEIIKAHDIKWREQIKVYDKRPEGSPYINPGITRFNDMNDVRETIKPKTRKKVVSRSE